MILTGTPNNFAAASASSCSVSGVGCSLKIVKRTSPLCGDVPTPCRLGNIFFSSTVFPSIEARRPIAGIAVAIFVRSKRYTWSGDDAEQQHARECTVLLGHDDPDYFFGAQ